MDSQAIISQVSKMLESKKEKIFEKEDLEADGQQMDQYEDVENSSSKEEI